MNLRRAGGSLGSFFMRSKGLKALAALISCGFVIRESKVYPGENSLPIRAPRT
jgi:hypothetical protein